VLRCFEDPDIVHVEGGIDPVRDAELVLTELMLADLDSLVRQRESLQRRVRGGDKAAAARLALVESLIPLLEDGRPARTHAPSPAEAPLLAELQLITAKPVLYVLNVEEASARAGNALSDRAAAWARSQGAASVVVSAAIEAELAALDPADRATYLASLGLESPGLERVVRAGYGLLGLLTFFTAGPKETRAWTVRKGATAPEAAGVIHSDFQRGFIAAEVIAYADYLRYGGEQGAKEAGRMRLEGRDYRIADGDVCNFRFNV
jgi:ribosome-binding ATPase